MADRSDKGVASPPPVIKVAIVEDQRQIREGLALLIGGTEGFCCAGSFGSMEEALHRLGSRSPDVVLVDIGLPGISGIEGIRLLKERHSKVLFLALTVYRDDQRIFDAICAGARGYLLKNTPPARLLESIQEIVSGGAPFGTANPSLKPKARSFYGRLRIAQGSI